MSAPRRSALQRRAAAAAAHAEVQRPRAVQPAEIAVHRLPPQLRVLVRVAGQDAAYALVRALGGTTVTLPKRVGGGWLLDLVGLQAAHAIVDEMGGLTVQLPKYDAVARQLRHRRVAELAAQGAALADVALATGYTVRQVINIRNAQREDGPVAERQGDLFDAPDWAD